MEKSNLTICQNIFHAHQKKVTSLEKNYSLILISIKLQIHPSNGATPKVINHHKS